MEREWHRGDFTISTDPGRLNLDMIHEFLSKEAYWALGRSRDRVERSIRHSLNFGLYHLAEQIGFARVVTDRATFAWLADVFVLPDFREQRLSKWLMTVISEHPELQFEVRLARNRFATRMDFIASSASNRSALRTDSWNVSKDADVYAKREFVLMLPFV